MPVTGLKKNAPRWSRTDECVRHTRRSVFMALIPLGLAADESNDRTAVTEMFGAVVAAYLGRRIYKRFSRKPPPPPAKGLITEVVQRRRLMRVLQALRRK